MTCANCPADAAYLIDEPTANSLAFCTTCLPAHLRPRAAAGEFDIPKPKSK